MFNGIFRQYLELEHTNKKNTLLLTDDWRLVCLKVYFNVIFNKPFYKYRIKSLAL